MNETQITNQILTSFVGTILALLSAGIVWLIKSAYEKYINESLALAKFERMLTLNITLLRDNLRFINTWIDSLKVNRPFSFHIESLVSNEEDTYKISDLKLINQILRLNYKTKRMSVDLENVYKSYWEIFPKIDSIRDFKKKKDELERYHKNVIIALEKMRKNYSSTEKEIINTIARVRVISDIRKYSFFNFIKLLFINIVPWVTKKSLDKKTKSLEHEVSLLK